MLPDGKLGERRIITDMRSVTDISLAVASGPWPIRVDLAVGGIFHGCCAPAESSACGPNGSRPLRGPGRRARCRDGAVPAAAQAQPQPGAGAPGEPEAPSPGSGRPTVTAPGAPRRAEEGRPAPCGRSNCPRPGSASQSRRTGPGSGRASPVHRAPRRSRTRRRCRTASRRIPSRRTSPPRRRSDEPDLVAKTGSQPPDEGRVMQAATCPTGMTVDLKVLVLSANGTETGLPAITPGPGLLRRPLRRLQGGAVGPDRRQARHGQPRPLPGDHPRHVRARRRCQQSLAAEWQTLWNYETCFGVRQATYYTLPHAATRLRAALQRIATPATRGWLPP